MRFFLHPMLNVKCRVVTHNCVFVHLTKACGPRSEWGLQAKPHCTCQADTLAKGYLCWGAGNGSPFFFFYPTKVLFFKLSHILSSFTNSPNEREQHLFFLNGAFCNLST